MTPRSAPSSRSWSTATARCPSRPNGWWRSPGCGCCAASYGVTEVRRRLAARPLAVAPLTLPDSGQLRLKRMYPGARYRATTSTVQVPIPRAGGVGAPRIRDLELVQMVADLLRRWTGNRAESTGGHVKQERQAR